MRLLCEETTLGQLDVERVKLGIENITVFLTPVDGAPMVYVCAGEGRGKGRTLADALEEAFQAHATLVGFRMTKQSDVAPVDCTKSSGKKS